MNADELKASAETSQIFADACMKHVRGQAGVAAALGESERMITRYCDPEDTQSFQLRKLPLLPERVRNCFLEKLRDKYETRDQPKNEVQALPSPEAAGLALAAQAGAVCNVITEILPQGITPDEADRADAALDEAARVIEQARKTIRAAVINGKGR